MKEHTIRIGVRAHDYGKRTPEGLFAAIAGDGWNSVQLACKKALIPVETPEDVTPALLERIKSALEKNGLDVGVLGSYVELAHADKTVRRQSAAEFCANLRIAKALGAGCVGSETTRVDAASRADGMKRLFHSLEQILPEAERLEVRVGIEPVAAHTLATPELARELLDTLQSPWLWIIFDPVNLLTPENFRNQDDLWKRSFDCFGERIAAVHMKGGALRDGKIAAVPFPDSQVDYDVLFRSLRALTYDFPLLRDELEDVSRAREDLAFLKSRL